MLVTRGIRLKKLISWTWHHVLWLMFFMGAMGWLYHEGYVKIVIPWLPISVIGTAVAFYVGFKNNQAYDRMWEARKIWGSIVNSSRAWGMYVDGFISNQFRNEDLSSDQIHDQKKVLIYRHIAWLYALRRQLLAHMEWEHISQGGLMGKSAKMYQDHFGIGLVNDEENSVDISNFLQKEEYDRLIVQPNTATGIINEQSRHLAKLREEDMIDDFRHMELEKILYDFYEQQGKCERIKKFPLPRQYANMSRYFVGIFIFLIPFSMIPQLMVNSELGFWVSIPITALIGWIFVMMEIIGDYSENPFSGMANDIPMLSLSRTIEIDLRVILGEKDLPSPIQSTNDILM